MQTTFVGDLFGQLHQHRIHSTAVIITIKHFNINTKIFYHRLPFCSLKYPRVWNYSRTKCSDEVCTVDLIKHRPFNTRKKTRLHKMTDKASNCPGISLHQELQRELVPDQSRTSIYGFVHYAQFQQNSVNRRCTF